MPILIFQDAHMFLVLNNLEHLEIENEIALSVLNNQNAATGTSSEESHAK